MGARLGTLCVPATPRIKFTQVGEQAMSRRIEVCSLLRDPLSQELDFSIHEELIADHSDIESLFVAIAAMICSYIYINCNVWA